MSRVGFTSLSPLEAARYFVSKDQRFEGYVEVFFDFALDGDAISTIVEDNDTDFVGEIFDSAVVRRLFMTIARQAVGEREILLAEQGVRCAESETPNVLYIRDGMGQHVLDCTPRTGRAPFINLLSTVADVKRAILDLVPLGQYGSDRRLPLPELVLWSERSELTDSQTLASAGVAWGSRLIVTWRIISHEVASTHQSLLFDMVDTSRVRESAETLVGRMRDSQITDNVFLSIEEMAVVEQTIAPQLEAARAKTNEILSEPCVGRVGDEKTVFHIMNNLCKGFGKEMVLFDSAESPDLPNSLMNLSVAFGEKSQQLDVRLENFEDLGISPEEEKGISVDSLNAGRHPRVVQRLREKLAAAHGVGVEAIEIQAFYDGSKGTRYTVNDLTTSAIEKVQGLVPKLKTQFSKFLEAKIHPLFYRTHFDISMFAPEHNKDFANENSEFNVGPAGKTRKYKQPQGWYRYALNVLGRYSNDKWLHPFGNPGMWYKAYHGTSEAKDVHFTKTKHLLLNDAPVNAVANIYTDGFHISGTVPGVSRYGKGVYCAPNAERAYKAKAVVETKKGNKSFEFLIMCAVKPDSFADEGWCWVVEEKENIRSYGLLVREVP